MSYLGDQLPGQEPRTSKRVAEQLLDHERRITKLTKALWALWFGLVMLILWFALHIFGGRL